MDRFRPRLTYANVVSTLCLFIVLGGGAWAAGTRLGKESVGTAQLKKNAVTGAKVRNGSLTGADIKASTLGEVPKATSAETAGTATSAKSADTAGHAATAGSADHATSADSATKAGDATTLDGESSSAFLPADRVARVAYEAHWETDGPEARTILTAGPFTLSASCFDSELGGTHTVVRLFGTGPEGSTVDWSQMIPTGVTAGNVVLEPSTPNEILPIFSGDPSSANASVILVYRDSLRTISIPLGVFVAGAADTCRVSGSAVVAEELVEPAAG